MVAARGGDRASFGQLVRRHGPRLLGLARQMLGPDGAEDAVQEAMIDAYRGLGGFAGSAAVRERFVADDLFSPFAHRESSLFALERPLGAQRGNADPLAASDIYRGPEVLSH